MGNFWEETLVKEAKNIRLSPPLLREFLDLRIRGYTFVQIEQRTGTSRETVSKYLKRLDELNARNRGRYLVLVVSAFANLSLRYFDTAAEDL